MLSRVGLLLLPWFCLWSRARRTDRSWAGQAVVLSEGLCRYGNSLECCWGWRQTEQGQCQPHCQQGCKNGDCLGPDRCKCHPGYAGKACNQDLNECGLKPRPCKHRCMNTVGSYKCFCQDGFALHLDGSCRNARTCYHANCQYGCEVIKGAVRCTCPSPGLRLGPDRRTCIDVDECEHGGGVCPRRRKCVNTFGSFLCKCHLGYKLTYLDGRYTCINKDPRPFCSLNPGSPKCRCRDGRCHAVPKVTLEPERPRTIRTTTPMSTPAAPAAATARTAHTTRRSTAATASPTTTTTATTTVPSTVATPPTVPPTVATPPTVPPTVATPPTVPPTVATPPTVPTSTATPPTVPPTVATPPTVPTSTATPPTVPPTVATPPTVPPTVATPPTVPPTVATPPTVPTSTATPPTVPPTVATPPTVPPTTATPPTVPTSTATPPTVPTSTATPPTVPTSMPPTVPPTTATPPTVPTSTAMPPTMPPTTATPPTAAATSTVYTTFTSATDISTATTIPATSVTTTPTMTIPVTTVGVSSPTHSLTTSTRTTTVAMATTAQTTTSWAKTTINNRINKEVTHRQRGDVHIPRHPGHNQVWEFDIELGNTALRDDPGALELHCSFDGGLCDWMSERDGDLRWQVARGPAGERYLSVPALRVGQRSVRGARLSVAVAPPWSHHDLCFSFSHWLTGHQVGVLQLFVRGRDQRYSPALWSRTGGHGWRHTQVTLTTHSLDRVLLKAERRKGRGQIAIDEVTLRQGACR